jgi:hypothetical protein
MPRMLLLLMIPALADFPLERVLPLKANTHHVQGIDFDSRRIWVSSVDAPNRTGYLQEFSLATGDLLREIKLGDGVRFHPGGISADSASLWIPVAEYRRDSSSVIERRNKETLELEFRFSVSDHIGCVAVTPELVIGGNWDSRTFYVWDHKGTLIRKHPNPTPNAYQDIKYLSHRLVASGLLPGRVGAIDWLDPADFKLLQRVNAGQTDRGEPYTREAMAIGGGRLFLLPEDAPSRLFVFRLPAPK